jgi:hypothetical protein
VNTAHTPMGHGNWETSPDPLHNKTKELDYPSHSYSGTGQHGIWPDPDSASTGTGAFLRPTTSHRPRSDLSLPDGENAVDFDAILADARRCEARRRDTQDGAA